MALLTTLSCNQENIGVEYSDTNEGVSFFYKTSSLLAETESTSITYQIGRSNTAGRLELPLETEYDTDVFTLPSSVVFEDGSGIATLTIPLENTILGTTYPITLAFDKVKASPFGYFETTINVMRDYLWLPAGVAEMTSAWAGATADVGIEQADGASPARYRLVSPYFELEPDYCEPGFHLVFELDENHNALNFFDGQKIGETYDGDILIFYAVAGDTFTNNGNVFTIMGNFYDDTGGWGSMPEVFTWKEGYPGDEDE